MKYSELISDITFWTGADKNISSPASFTDFTNDNRTLSLNHWYHKVVTMILQSQDDWDWDDTTSTDNNYPIGTADLVVNQPDYTLPASLKLLKIKRVEYTPDGSNWYKVEPMDINERSHPNDTSTLARDFQKTKPYYDIMGNAIFLYPTPTDNVVGGLKIWFYREPQEFTTSDTTREPGIDEPFHRMLSIGASLDFAIAKNLPHLITTLGQLLQDYENRLRNHYGNREVDRSMIMKSIYNDYL